jgi:hypothetical protein
MSSEWQEPQTTRTGSLWPWILVALGALIVIGLAVAGPLSRDATDRADARSAAQQAIAASAAAQAQAASQAAQTVERERTERERQAQETTRAGAELRAERDQRTQNSLLIIGVITLGLIVVFGLLGFTLWGVSWSSDRNLQRTVMLIEAQRLTAQMQLEGTAAFLLPARRAAQPARRERAYAETDAEHQR